MEGSFQPEVQRPKIIREPEGWEHEQVPQLEIGEMKGRPKGEKATVLEYIGWFLKEQPLLKVVFTAGEYEEPVPNIGASPGEMVEANRENERRDWQRLFDQHYPEITADEIASLEFNDMVWLTALGRHANDMQPDVDLFRSKLVGKDGKPKNNIVIIDTPKVGSAIEGESGKTHDFESVSEWVAQEIKKLEEQGKLKTGNKTLVGHSKGGYYAAMIAAKYPELVSNIICVSTPFKPSERPPAPWLLPLLNTLQKLPVNGMLDLLEQKFKIPKEKFNTMLIKAKPSEMLATYLNIPQIKWEEVLGRIPRRIRTAFTKGRQDGALDSMGYEASKVVPEATLIGLPDGGHGRPSPNILLKIAVGEQKKVIGFRTVTEKLPYSI